MSSFLTFLIGGEVKKWLCFERPGSVFSVLSGRLTFQEIVGNEHTRTSTSNLCRAHPLQKLQIGGVMKEKESDQLPQICFLGSVPGMCLSLGFASRHGKQNMHSSY